MVDRLVNGRRFAVVAAALALVTLACTCGGLSNVAELAGGALQGDESAAGLTGDDIGTDIEADVEAPQEAEPPAGEADAGDAADGSAGAPAAGGETFLFEGLNQDTYETLDSAVMMSFEGTNEQGEPVSVDIEGTVQIQREPFMMAMQYTTADFEGVDAPGTELLPGQGGNMTFYVTSDSAYMELSGLCFAFPLDPDEMMGEEFADVIVDPGEYLDPAEGELELQYVGDETVNGLATEHYQATNVQMEDFEASTVDVWYAPGEGRIARMAMVGTGAHEFGEGTTDITWDLLSVNEPLDITVPENCVAFDIPETTE